MKSRIKWNKKIGLVYSLMETLYNLDESACGGLCHTVTDDGNIDDDSLKWVIDYTKRESNENRVDCELSRAICEILLYLSMEQRMFLFAIIDSEVNDGALTEEKWDEYHENKYVITHLKWYVEEYYSFD